MSTAPISSINVSGHTVLSEEIINTITNDTRDSIISNLLDNLDSGSNAITINTSDLNLDGYTSSAGTPVFTKTSTLVVAAKYVTGGSLTVTSAQAEVYNIYSPIETGATLKFNVSDSVMTNAFSFTKLNDDGNTNIVVYEDSSFETVLLQKTASKGDILYVKHSSDGTMYMSSENTSDTFMTIAIGSVNVDVKLANYVPTNLIAANPNRGIMPSAGYVQDKSFVEYAHVRKTLARAWNSNYPAYLAPGTKAAQSPFRLVNNAGDILSRTNYSCKKNGGGCDASGVPAAACNSKFVYDGSDYIRFKKQLAHNKNYNDVSSGGSKQSSQLKFRVV